MVRVNSWASGVRTTYERVASRFESGVQLLERRYTPLGRFSPGPFEGWSFLWQPALLGFAAMVAIVAGALVHQLAVQVQLDRARGSLASRRPSATGTPSITKYILSVVLVYGGLLLLMRVWLRLAEVMKLHVGAPLKKLWWIFGLWSVPMIVAPPLFSRDVFSYAAQGEMTALHISPYLYGPYTLGAVSNAWTAPVDPLWSNTPAPYGPFFLFTDSTIVRLSGNHQLWTVVGLRFLEVIAVVMIGFGVAMLARGLGRDPGEAFVLCRDESPRAPHSHRRSAQRRPDDRFLGDRPRTRRAATSGVGPVFRLARHGHKSARRDRSRVRRVELAWA